MPGHRRCHLPQRIGEDIRQHQVERPARGKLRRGKSGGADGLHPIPGAVEPRIVAGHLHRQRIDVARQHLIRSALAAAIASTPVPVPRSSTRRGRCAFSTWSSSSEAAARGAVVAGAERQRRLDLDAELVGRNLRAVMLAVHDEAPGADRDQFLERGLDPVLGLDRVERDAPRGLVAGGDGRPVRGSRFDRALRRNAR